MVTIHEPTSTQTVNSSTVVFHVIATPKIEIFLIADVISFKVLPKSFQKILLNRCLSTLVNEFL